MKKILFFGVFLVLMFAVCASTMQLEVPGKGTMAFDDCGEHYFFFEQGWNLVAGLPGPDFLAGGPVEATNIKAIYGLDPITKDYVRFYPQPDLSNLKTPIDYMIGQTAFWVYSDTAGETEVWGCSMQNLDGLDISGGWNMFALTRDMFEKSLNDIKGDCRIEKVYAFSDGAWLNAYEDLVEDDMKFEKNHIGMGLLIDFADDCDLGPSSADLVIAPPPTLPVNG